MLNISLMKRFIYLTFALCITLMCVSLTEAQGRQRNRYQTVRHYAPARREPARYHYRVRPVYRPVPIPVHRVVRHEYVVCRPVGLSLAEKALDIALTAAAINACNNVAEATAAVAERGSQTSGLISKLPDNCEKVRIGDETYYKVGETLYKVVLVDGTPYFEVFCSL